MDKIIRVLLKIDLFVLSNLYKISSEKPALIVFNFHKIFKSKYDIATCGVDPQQGTTTDDFRLFIEYFLAAGYIFIHPEDIPEKLNPQKKYILITFDDGYYNNIYTLPLIKEYKIPVIFFISSNHVITGKAFWWDVVYRLKERGIISKEITSYKNIIKKMNPIQVDKFLQSKFSDEMLKPKNNYDRPFRIDELLDFSHEQFVIIGNHTADHAVLTYCTNKEVEYQIEKAQKDLKNITGKKPQYLSYPNGNYSNEIVETVRKQNFKLAFTMLRKKNYLPIIDSSNLFKIHRFMLSKFCQIEKDGLLFRSNYSLYNSGINFYSKFKNTLSLF